MTIHRALAVLGIVLAAPAGAVPPGHRPGEVVRVEHRDPTTAPTRGPASAPVTIEVFLSPAVSTAGRAPAYRSVERLQANHPARIRIIYRIIKRTAHIQVPTAALEAHAQGLFFEFMDELNRFRPAAGPTQPPTRGEVLEIAKRVGMDTQRVALAISGDRYHDVFEANDRRFERLSPGASSVPVALFNDRPPRGTLAQLGDADLEREYVEAYDRALELIDRGVDPRRLMTAFDTQALHSAQPFITPSGPPDDDPDTNGDHRLASPPLPLAGLPSFGKPDAAGAVPVVVLCRPNDNACGNTMRVLRGVQETYSDEVRLVWAPWFDVARDDAAELTLLGDAALCAEQVGTSPDDISASPGWRWITKQLEQANRQHGRRVPADRLIDNVTAEVELDSGKLSACRARIANATLDWIAAARRSGVAGQSAIVIGGRIYQGLADKRIIQQLIEAELAPGVLGDVAPDWRGAR